MRYHGPVFRLNYAYRIGTVAPIPSATEIGISKNDASDDVIGRMSAVHSRGPCAAAGDCRLSDLPFLSHNRE